MSVRTATSPRPTRSTSCPTTSGCARVSRRGLRSACRIRRACTCARGENLCNREPELSTLRERTMSALTEQRTLHFDLSCFSPDREFTLLAGGGRKVLLKRYADHSSKMDEHRSRNRCLGMIPEARVKNITHFCEDAEMGAIKPSMRSIVLPSLDDH